MGKGGAALRGRLGGAWHSLRGHGGVRLLAAVRPHPHPAGPQHGAGSCTRERVPHAAMPLFCWCLARGFRPHTHTPAASLLTISCPLNDGYAVSRHSALPTSSSISVVSLIIRGSRMRRKRWPPHSRRHPRRGARLPCHLFRSAATARGCSAHPRRCCRSPAPALAAWRVLVPTGMSYENTPL